MPENQWEGFQRRDRSREPLLLILTPITPTREDAIKTVASILAQKYSNTAWSSSDIATEIIDALTRVRGPVA